MRSDNPKTRSALIGAAFLMATSAIGPGFITQTTVFTEKLLTSFAFVILCSVLIDIVVQMNIWRVVAASQMRTQDLANKTIRGSGQLLTVLIVLGGLAFNTGNLAGAGLGIEVMTGLNLHAGVIVSVLISLFIFWYREAGMAMDLFAKVLGVLMLLLTGYIAIISKPPVGLAMKHMFMPEQIDTGAIIVLVGGTVGGYISFAGIHRLLDAGISGPKSIRDVTAASVKAILLASTMRILLFLAALGVVYSGAQLDPQNPAATVFQLAAGRLGYVIFGLVLWSASITSVVGSAYTSVSFITTFHASLEANRKWLVTGFVIISGIVFMLIGRPVNVLVAVGALNAFILPLALSIILIAAARRKYLGDYVHPAWMMIFGWFTVIALTLMSFQTAVGDLPKIWQQ